MIYKSHKPIIYSQQNIENIPNVARETFHSFMKNISLSWIRWEQHVLKKIYEQQKSGEASIKKKEAEKQVTTYWFEVTTEMLLWSNLKTGYSIIYSTLYHKKIQRILTTNKSSPDSCDLQALYIKNRNLEKLHQCWKVYTGFRATSAPIQIMSFSGKTLHISARQC